MKRCCGMGQVVTTPLSDWGMIGAPCQNWGTPATASGTNTVVPSGASPDALTWGALLVAGLLLWGVFGENH